MKVAEIAKLVGGTVIGDDSVEISGGAGIKEANSEQITFFANLRYASALKTTDAAAIFVPEDIEVESDKVLIKTQDPSLAFAQVMANMTADVLNHPKGIHPSAVIHESAKLGDNVALGACAVIEAGAEPDAVCTDIVTIDGTEVLLFE